MAKIVYEPSGIITKRNAQYVNVTDKIQRYGFDNAYPQRIKEIVNRSSTLKSLLQRIADFVNGEGFDDAAIGNMIVNNTGLYGQSLNKILQVVSNTYVWYNSICLHINYNLLGNIVSITPIPFEYCRFGLQDSNGKITKIAYSTNWERDSLIENQRNIEYYDVFNSDISIVTNQIEAVGISNYKGQILYITPTDGVYPLATFDSVLEDAQTQKEISVSKLASAQNSFMATMAIVYPGEFDTVEEKKEFNNLIKNKSGASSAGSIIGIQDKTGTKKASDIFQSLSPENLDKLYELTEKTIKENIIQSESFPPVLLGFSQNGLFAKADIEDAYTYANSITRNRRYQLSEIFSFLISKWINPIQSAAYIREQQYIVYDDAGISEGDVNQVLRNMSGAQSINFTRILRKYEQELFTRPVTEMLLKSGFGLSIEQVKTLLDNIDTEKQNRQNGEANKPA